VRLPLALLIACLTLALPAGASAAVSFSSFKVTPSTTQAGAHPTVTIDAAFNVDPTSDDVKSLGVTLPQGLVGDPNAADRCKIADFTADACPASSKVGTTTASVIATVPPGLVEVPQDAPGDVYNLQPQGGEAARLGIVLRPTAAGVFPLDKVFLQSGVTTGPQTGYGLLTLFDNLPRASGGLDTRVVAQKLVLNANGAHGAFLTNPTDCRTATTQATVTSYDQPNAPKPASSSFTPTGCDKLPFAPHLAGSLGGIGTTTRGTSPTLITAITTSPGDANPSRVSVSLPPAVQTNLSAKVTVCTLANVAAGTCPASSRVGSASASSPLLPEPLTGPVLVAGDPGTGLPSLSVQLGPPVPLSLTGKIGLGNGLVTNTFDGLPDLPLSRFELTVNGGGTSGLLANAGNVCGTKLSKTARGEFLAHSGKTASVTANFAVVGCDPAHPGSSVSQTGGEGRPRGTLSLAFRRGSGTLKAKFRAGKSAAKLNHVRLALPKALRTGARGKKLPKRLRVLAGKRKLTRKQVRVGAHTIDIRLGKKRSATVSLRWAALKPKRSLARRLGKHPKLVFVARVGDATPRTTRLRLTVRPSVRRR
jgi:hypothetical protein